jgi:hypothetical protein
MDEVVASYSGAVSVSHHIYYRKFGTGKLYAGGEHERAPMSRMDGAGVYVTWHATGASDTRGYHGPFFLATERRQGAQQRMHDDAMPTAWAPDVGEKVHAQPV